MVWPKERGSPINEQRSRVLQMTNGESNSENGNEGCIGDGGVIRTITARKGQMQVNEGTIHYFGK